MNKIDFKKRKGIRYLRDISDDKHNIFSCLSKIRTRPNCGHRTTANETFQCDLYKKTNELFVSNFTTLCAKCIKNVMKYSRENLEKWLVSIPLWKDRLSFIPDIKISDFEIKLKHAFCDPNTLPNYFAASSFDHKIRCGLNRDPIKWHTEYSGYFKDVLKKCSHCQYYHSQMMVVKDGLPQICYDLCSVDAVNNLSSCNPKKCGRGYT